MNFALILTIFGGFLLVASSIAFFRAKDAFLMILTIKITNFYVIPILLIAFALEKFSALTFSKILIIIVLNVIMTILLCHLISRRALNDKIEPDADFIEEK